MLVELAINLIQLTGPTGLAIFVNPSSITSLRVPSVHYEQHVAPGVHCLVQTPGRTFGVADQCGAISIMLRQ